MDGGFGHCDLYIPGRILHIVPKNGDAVPRGPNPVFKVTPPPRSRWDQSSIGEWVEVMWSEQRRFEEVKLSRWMMTDHMPHNVIKVLRSVQGCPLPLPLNPASPPPQPRPAPTVLTTQPTQGSTQASPMINSSE